MENPLKKRNPIALDISDYSIELLQLNRKKEVLAHGRVVLDEATVRDGEVINVHRLVAKIDELLQITRPKKLAGAGTLQAIASLPESKVFIHYFELPKNVRGDALRQRVLEEAAKNIPFDPTSIYSDYAELSRGKTRGVFGKHEASLTRSPGDPSQKTILYVGALKDVVDEYREALRRADIELAALDIESNSLSRALLKAGPQTTSSMIVDIGAKTTSISIFDPQGTLSLSVTVPVAGNHFTKAIAKKLNKKEEEAEDLKKSFGFNQNVPDNPVLPILRAESRKIVTEIQAALRYYEEAFAWKVGEVVLAGGSSLVPEFDAYLAAQLEKRVTVGNPLQKIRKSDILLEANPPIVYANVIGLALRSASGGYARRGINLLPASAARKEREKKRTSSVMVFTALLFAILGQAVLTFIIYYFLFR